MRLNKLILISLCLVPITTYARDWPNVVKVNVDKIKEEIKKHKKDHPSAKLSVEYEDEVFWYSKDEFSIVKFEEEGVSGATNPFEKPISEMKSHQYHHNKNRWILYSGPPRADLFTEQGKAKKPEIMQEKHYKATFMINGVEVDPHIIIRP